MPPEVGRAGEEQSPVGTETAAHQQRDETDKPEPEHEQEPQEIGVVEDDQLAVLDGQRDAVQRLALAVGDMQIGNGKHCGVP